MSVKKENLKKVRRDMNLRELSPFIRVASDNKIDFPWTLSTRVLFDYELLYIKAGRAQIIIKDQTYEGRPGDILILKPGVPHSIKLISEECFHQPHIHFDFIEGPDSDEVKVSFRDMGFIKEDELKYFREDFTHAFEGITLPDKIRLKNTDTFETMLFDLISEYNSKMPFYELKTKGLFINLWIYLCRELYWEHHKDIFNSMKEIIGMKNYIMARLEGQLCLDELAGEFNMSKYHIIKLFNKLYGTSPIRFHQLQKLNKAKELIQYSDKSLTEIASIMGFKSVHVFSRAFKNALGVPPSFYRSHEVTPH